MRTSRKLWCALGTVAAVAATIVLSVTDASATTVPGNTGSIPLSATKVISGGTFDGGMKRYYGTGALGSGGQNEGEDPLFDLPNGGTLKNVILGSPASDGVHCEATCTLQNVWWEDVGEDAATFKPKSSGMTMTILGGGALHAADKVFQHNGTTGGTFVIDGFQVEDFGKLYRSCGNCKSGQSKRNVIIRNVTATYKGGVLAGINTNYGDTATFSNITILNDANKKIVICQKYIGNSTGAEPPKNGSGADGTYCKYSSSDIHYK
ncbi:pectate lyase [Actinoplanes subtropicus]|uniref:pectate lyase n=1 Tax=Actinoplanes subtropicus TaxID=543632 RepID=UPI0004C3790C|nr:pectate lyase [Actinoplanes subtropicus]